MKLFLRKIFESALVLLVLAGAGYYYRDSISHYGEELLNRVQPCEHPLAYSLASVDPRFGISQAELLKKTEQAADIWNAALGRQLLAYSPAGDLKIRLVYDSRQQTTDELKSLGIAINDDKATYDALKAKYDSLVAGYNQQKAQLKTLIDNYNAAKDEYQKEVAYWNSRGGAPKPAYDALQQSAAALNSQADIINQDETALNQLVATINSTAAILNKLVAELNAQGNTYNTVGSLTGSQFEEGEYTNDANGPAIAIYQFDNEDKLVRVLAHEFGHALGLGHIDNPKAIMYYLNEGINEQLTPDDLAALKKVCRIN